MFFMLHAQRESVNGSWTHPNWSVDEWASFLREAMGVNANDIANAIVDNYYSLSAAEETGLKAVICTPAEEVISLERVRSLPQKKMWKVSVTHNGVDLSCDKDVQAVAPTSGQNRVVVQALSPTGVAYTRTWEQDAFIYHALKDNEKLYADVTNVIKKAKEEGVSGKGFSELERYANDPSKPYNKTKIALLPKVVVEVNNEIVRCGKLRQFKGAVSALASRIKGIGGIDQADPLSKTIGKVGNRISAINNSITSGMSVQQIDASMEEVNGLGASVTKIEEELGRRKTEQERIENARTDLLELIKNKNQEFQNEAERRKEKWTNSAEFAAFSLKAEKVGSVPDANLIRSNVEKWTAKYSVTPKPVVKAVPPPDEALLKCEVARTNLISLINQKMASWPSDEFDQPKNFAELKAFLKETRVAKNLDELEAVGKKVNAWKAILPSDSHKSGGIGFIEIVFALVVIGAIAFGVKKVLKGKPVATVKFSMTGSTDVPLTAELKLNKVLRYDECLGCPVDVRVTPKMNDESHVLEYEFVSPNKTVWMLKVGGERKKEVGEVALALDEGVYLLFDNEIAMQPIGRTEFGSIED